jgi:1-acyl-sn-glycerol-3-phosphate acyltransferase
MLEGFRSRNPGRSVPGILFYEFCWHVCLGVLKVFFGLRIRDRQNDPPLGTGAYLVVVNHQSHLDPILAGMAVRRRHLHFIARSGLFSNPLFGWLIRSLNSIPLNQKAADTAAMRTSIELLKSGRTVLIFPEGSRTPDGAMHGFKRGFWLLLSRSQAPIIPVAIEGAFDAWPRRASRPTLFRTVRVKVAPSIPAQTLLDMGEPAALRHLQNVIENMRQDLADELRAEGVRITTQPRVDAHTD